MLRAAESIQRTDTGRQRSGNEDSYYVRAPVFVVADGMGGARAGEVASRMAVQVFEAGLPDKGSPEERLSLLVQQANRSIYEKAQADPELSGMGTTLTSALLDGDHVAIAHVGDSRAYLLRDGTLTRLTQDHSLVEELLQRGKLTEEEAAEHPQRSIITRALGPEPIVEVDTYSQPVRPGDVVMLCSDGLTSMISEKRVEEVLRDSPGLREAADRLVAEANEAGGRDNITVVLFRVEEVDGSQPVDQPTIAPGNSTASATRPGAGNSRPSKAGSNSHADGAARNKPSGGSDITRIVPLPQAPSVKPRRAALARTQGFVRPADRPRHFGRLGKTVAATTAIVVVLFLVGGGGYLASRQLYFLGTNGQGIVTVYRGLPYILPFGIPMYETFYTSGVPASLIPADRRATLLNHDLRSQSAATNLINAIERGEISG